MKLFWKWMEKKGYADLRDYINNEYYIINKNKNSGVALKPEKQMLIGYMMEYIICKNNKEKESTFQGTSRNNCKRLFLSYR